jgi:hypothetical protein
MRARFCVICAVFSLVEGSRMDAVTFRRLPRVAVLGQSGVISGSIEDGTAFRLVAIGWMGG